MALAVETCVGWISSHGPGVFSAHVWCEESAVLLYSVMRAASAVIVLKAIPTVNSEESEGTDCGSVASPVDAELWLLAREEADPAAGPHQSPPAPPGSSWEPCIQWSLFSAGLLTSFEHPSATSDYAPELRLSQETAMTARPAPVGSAVRQGGRDAGTQGGRDAGTGTWGRGGALDFPWPEGRRLQEPPLSGRLLSATAGLSLRC